MRGISRWSHRLNIPDTRWIAAYPVDDLSLTYSAAVALALLFLGLGFRRWDRKTRVPMIHFCSVSKRASDERNGARFVLREVTVSLPGNARIALLGEDQRALTTTLHLLAGSEVPDHGRIIADRLRRSPIINAGSMAGSSLARKLSGLENINFFARIHGIDAGHLLAVVEFGLSSRQNVARSGPGI